MKTIEYSDTEKINEMLLREGLELDKAMSSVAEIMRNVRKRGDSALFEYTQRFDDFKLTKENIKVGREAIKKAYSNINPSLTEALVHAHRNITKFHCEQKKKIKEDWSIEVQNGIKVGEKITAIEAVGCYVPGGRAPYPSTVLMTCTPARAAGVERVVITSPPPIPDSILVAADICGVEEIYRIGGAQAIAALAYGTESIPRVNKIVGPGNVYVMAAKMLAYGKVDIDMPAGPSEVLILADETADPTLIASDLLAQAEHDPKAQCILVTNSGKLRERVEKEISEQIKGLKTRETAEQSLKNAAIILTKNLQESIEFANRYAPEHLEIMTEDPERIVGKIKNAGAIFLGEYAPVAAGDYASGGNHVLPTGGTARFSSQLSVRDFLKTSSVQRITKDGLSRLKNTIEKIADAEGFDAHRKSVEKRFQR
ncbi:MAG: histidinol dehydrogenase [Candidatus Altiarchaeota archaeon]|nr:histidinol dehydrogenase [Candidatus Altiarchaeota archaeon]